MRPCAEADQRQLRDERQARVRAWTTATFGGKVADDTGERAHRFIEEALELAQACGVSIEKVSAIAERVYSRSVGDLSQEIGGVGVTLLALCENVGVSAEAEECRELERVLSIPPERFRAKQAEKARAGTSLEPEIAPAPNAPLFTAEGPRPRTPSGLGCSERAEVELRRLYSVVCRGASRSDDVRALAQAVIDEHLTARREQEEDALAARRAAIAECVEWAETMQKEWQSAVGSIPNRDTKQRYVGKASAAEVLAGTLRALLAASPKEAAATVAAAAVEAATDAVATVAAAEEKRLTPRRISEIALAAYRAMGYRVIDFGGGDLGILKCPPKTVALMATFQALLMDEVDPPIRPVEEPALPPTPRAE